MQITPNPVEFGEVTIGGSKEVDVTVTNTDAVAVAPDPVITAGGDLFSVPTENCGTLDEDESCGFTVRYEPAEEGPDTGTLRVNDTIHPSNHSDATLNGTAKEPPGAKRHYIVELKAWIPKAAVVDPNLPFATPYPLALIPPLSALVTPEPRAPCFRPPDADLVTTKISSRFRGDDHAEYFGSYRVRPVAEFDFDGSQITNFEVSTENFGVTSLDYTFSAFGGRVVQRCSRTATQVERAGGRKTSARTFELSMSADDPLVYPRPFGLADSAAVPNIDATLTGSLQSSGALVVRYDTDLFPSHGIRVVIGNAVRDSRVTNDVSCLDDSSVTGLFGMGLLATALSLHENADVYSVQPAQARHEETVRSRFCDSSFLTLDFVSFGRQQLQTLLNQGRASATAASARSRLRVAPVVNGKTGKFVTLNTAVGRGLVTSYTGPGNRLAIGVDPTRPVVLKTKGTAALRTARLQSGKRGKTLQYGPIRGRIVARLGSSVKVTRNGKRVRGRRPDRKPPRTRAKVRFRGKRAIVTLVARDRSGVQSTVATYKGKRIKIRRQRFKIARRKLRRVLVSSVDVYGNAERPHRIRRRR
jgi:hypothetical protein